MRIYTQSDTNTFASTNGYLSLTYGSSQFASQEFPASNIPNNTVAPFFDDLYLDGSEDPPQGIFYQISGGAVTYEWYIGRGGAVGRIYHFTVRYDSAVPGVFTYTYYSTGGEVDQGEYASVGAQGSKSHLSQREVVRAVLTGVRRGWRWSIGGQDVCVPRAEHTAGAGGGLRYEPEHLRDTVLIQVAGSEGGVGILGSVWLYAVNSGEVTASLRRLRTFTWVITILRAPPPACRTTGVEQQSRRLGNHAP